MIDHPLSDRDAWVLLFSNNSLPVLRATKRRLGEMRDDLDNVDARELAQLILRDPIMTVRVLAYIQPFRGRSLQHDITTIAGAVMMSGLLPFFRRFDNLPTIEETLKGFDPHALLGVLHVIRRDQRAADYAQDWAIRRQDMNLEEIRIAALLHDLAEILVWCFAPKLTLAIQALQQAQPTMRSADAQYQVLGLTYQDIQRSLCKVWHLPDLLALLIDDQHSEQTRVRNVSLAVRLARHSAHGWNDPALPDDYREIGALINLTPDGVRRHIGVPAADDQPQ
jgi:HD-like signal output (HDOD) protein